MGKEKIIIDTNNLISALGWGGLSGELMQMVFRGEFELLLSLKQIEELKRVMEYPKFRFTHEQQNNFLSLLSETATTIKTKTELHIIKDDDDNMLLECAQDGKAQYIISGDKELLALKKHLNTRIVTVKEFLEMF